MRGGVGNQLFQLCAGLYFSEINCRNIFLDFSEISDADHKGFNITNASFFERSPLTNNSKTPYHLNPQSKVREFEERFLRFTNKYLRTYISQDSEFGEDNRIDSWGKAIKIKGYFQTSKYVDYLLREKILTLQDFFPAYPSSIAQEIKEYIEDKSPIVLHVRAGDYKNHTQSIGILGSTYYSEAILRFTNYSNREILMITDDVMHANQVLGKAGIAVTYIPETELLHPLELIYAMSHAEDFLIPNSSFSWWIAKLSNQRGTIVCPKDWFKGFGTPTGLKPSNWIDSNSCFID